MRRTCSGVMGALFAGARGGVVGRSVPAMIVISWRSGELKVVDQRGVFNSVPGKHCLSRSDKVQCHGLELDL